MRIKFGTYAYAERERNDSFKMFINDCTVWFKDDKEYNGEVSILCYPSFLEEDSFSEFRVYFDNYCIPLLVYHTGGIIANGKLWEESRTIIKQIFEFIKEHKEKIAVDIQI